MLPGLKFKIMRVLFISFEFGDHVLGGLGRVINGVTSALRQHVEVDVYLLYFNPRLLTISARLYRCNKHVQGELTETFPRQYVSSLINLIKREKYDMIHFFSVHWIIGKIIDRLTKERPEQKIVYSIHSLIKYEKGIRLNPSSFFRCEQKLIESARIIQVLNETSHDYFKSAYASLAADKPLHIIPNGVNAADFVKTDEVFAAKLRRRLKEDTFTVFCMSRWAHGKGLEYFVEAAGILLSRGRKVQFVLAGRKWISWEMKWYNYLWKIDRKVKKLGENIHVLGWLNSAQRNSLFRAADVFVMPSELEYFPYSVLEPAAAGIPLVASGLPCVREMLTDGEDALFFRPGDSRDLADKLEMLMDDPALMPYFAGNARERVLSEGDWDTIARQYVRMYDQVAEAHTPALIKTLGS